MRINMVVTSRPARPFGQLLIQAQLEGSGLVRNCGIAGREGNNAVIFTRCGGGGNRVITKFDPTGDAAKQPSIAVSGDTYTAYFKSGAWMRMNIGNMYFLKYFQ